MSEATPEGGNDSGTTPAADEFNAITTQDDLNKVIEERLKRERAKYVDYRDVKAKAAKLDEIEKANQTELEKATGAVTKAEGERDDAKAEAARLRVAVTHGISIEDADLFLTGRDEETLTAQAKRLVDREADRKKTGNHVPREGNNPKPGDDPMRAFARQVFKSGD